MKRRALTMSSQLISRIVSVCAAAFLLAACHAPALEEIRLPEEKEPVSVSERTTIPFSLKVSTEATKVSYDGGSYQFKEGDILHVQGIDRTDIEGDLTQNGDVWSGNLSYSGDVPADNTALKVTLIHADNTDTKTYASAIVGSGNVTGEVTTAKLLQYAVEHFSLFAAEDVTFETESAILKQQATFLDVNVTFIFDGTHEMGSGGNARIDLNTSLGPVHSTTAFVRQSETSHNYDAHFMAVIPGGATKDAFTLSVVDRVITFSYSNALERNKKYTVTRNIEFVPQLGDPFWNDGTYGRMDHSDENARIVGIIVYVNHDYAEGTDEAAIDDAITEKAAGFGHGLVMALHNVAEGVKWRESGTSTYTAQYVTTPVQTLDASNLSGYNNTSSIVEGGGVTAASRAAAYKAFDGDDAEYSHTTGWFLPSIGQWIYTISKDGFGRADPVSLWTDNASNPNTWLTLTETGLTKTLIRVLDNGTEQVNLLVKALNDRLAQLQTDFGENYSFNYDSFGIPEGNNNISDNYWTSSEYDSSQALRMNLGSVEYDKKVKHYYSTIKASPVKKTNTSCPIKDYPDISFPLKVRPFLAF